MSAWTWDAGPCCGIADERRLARRRAAAALRSGKAARAVLQEVVLDAGTTVLDDRYRPVGRRSEGYRDGAGIRWDSGVPA